jgi:hypothetical protein
MQSQHLQSAALAVRGPYIVQVLRIVTDRLFPAMHRRDGTSFPNIHRRQPARQVLSINDDDLEPAYYRRWRIEPIAFITANDLPFWLGNVIKYAMRYDAKDGLQDLQKARWYLELKIHELEGRNQSDD